MKRSPIKQVSSKQVAELAERRRVKQLLIDEQLETVGYTHCQTCGRTIYRIGPGYLELAHIKAQSGMRGGKTELGNCILEGGGFTCGCSSRFEKRPEDRPVESIGYKKWRLQDA
jgi:hypothetical protein